MGNLLSMSKLNIGEYGALRWKNKDGELHRDNGPAIIRSNGTQQWFKNDKRHREGGPAEINVNGDKLWYINGHLHREDGPALIRSNGDKFWYRDGVLIWPKVL